MRNNWNCRIGKVTLKKGGAQLHILENPRHAKTDEIINELIETTEQAAELYGDDMAGFLLMTWDWEGKANSGWRCENGVIRASMLPMWLPEILRREIACQAAQEEQNG